MEQPFIITTCCILWKKEHLFNYDKGNNFYSLSARVYQVFRQGELALSSIQRRIDLVLQLIHGLWILQPVLQM